MVAHQTVGVDLDAESFGDITEKRLEIESVGVGTEDVLPVCTAIRYMVPSVGDVDPVCSCHAPIMDEGCTNQTEGSDPSV